MPTEGRPHTVVDTKRPTDVSAAGRYRAGKEKREPLVVGNLTQSTTPLPSACAMRWKDLRESPCGLRFAVV